MLESTDAAGRVPYLRPTRLPAHRCRVWVFFFFPQIRVNSARFAPTQLDLRQIGFDSRRIGPYWPYWIVLAGDRYGRNKPKTAEISLETRQNRQNTDLRGVSCLLLSLFCESRHSNVFFKNILILKIYRKYK